MNRLKILLIILCILSAIEPQGFYYWHGSINSEFMGTSDKMLGGLLYAFYLPTGWLNLFYALILLFSKKIQKYISLKNLLLVGGIIHLALLASIFFGWIEFSSFTKFILDKIHNIGETQKTGSWDFEGSPIFLWIPYILIIITSLFGAILLKRKD